MFNIQLPNETRHRPPFRPICQAFHVTVPNRAHAFVYGRHLRCYRSNRPTSQVYIYNTLILARKVCRVHDLGHFRRHGMCLHVSGSHCVPSSYAEARQPPPRHALHSLQLYVTRPIFGDSRLSCTTPPERL